MNANFTQELEAIKAKGWTNNYFPLKNLRTKYAKKGLDVAFMWAEVSRVFAKK